MSVTLPGTTIEVSAVTKGISRTLFGGIFAAGGITLSQVSVMTGLEPYDVQNWVKRGFVSSPVGRVYSKDQFARICIINLLRESLMLPDIIKMLGSINGNLSYESDDLICDSELYHKYVDITADCNALKLGDGAIMPAVEAATADYKEPQPGAKKRLVGVLSVMAYAHLAKTAKVKAMELLCGLDG